jgi:phospholipid/cholesterol/gamma-HCH transport system ATP-binding protein
MLFQGGALFDSMSVFDNLAFPFREHRTAPETELPARVRELLAKVGLEGIEERAPADLSGGMRKRVALARALALEPEVLLFDEPTTGLDPMTSAAIARLILDTRRETGCATIVVTHDLALARTVADRIAFLDQGRFRFLGTFAEAAASPDPLLGDFLAGREESSDVA